jgi:two-component system, OmpR family, sensor kinase
VAAVSLRVRLLLALAYLLLLAIIALEVPLALSLRDRVDAEVRSQARGQADIVAATVAGRLEGGREAELAEVARTAGANARGRVIVVDATGTVLADSTGAERVGTDYADRPEIAAALRGDVAQEQRRSETLEETILATAVPVATGGRTEGAVRITQSVDAVGRATRQAILGLAAIGLLVLALGLGAGVLIAGQIAGPLRRLDAAAARIAGGDLSARAQVEGSAEQRRLARTFNEMAARVQRGLAAQRDFVADASHQLRTPLSGLRLRLEEARAGTREPDAQEEIDAGLGELDRLSAIITELLVLSQAGEVDAPAEEVDLAAAAARAGARWDSRVIVADPVPGPPVRCAPADLDRILDALVENALHYGGGRARLRARPGAIEVADDGAGLDPGELEAVFERFHRGREGRAGHPGTGLGLPIARTLARRWDGEVTIANRDGGGATATVALPGFPSP